MRSISWVLPIIMVTIWACGGTPTGPTSPSVGLPTASAPLPLGDTSLPASAATFIGAGDIAQCGPGGVPNATASLIESVDGTVFALGDNAYPHGSQSDYSTCYDGTWGRFRDRTRPVPGNHEYETADAQPYYAYFGGNAGPPGVGYYSFELGNWHVVALNSNVGVGSSSAQAAWLRADLSAHNARCTIAYWHFPLFSSSEHGNNTQMRDLWQVLYDAGADVVMAGHDHVYERFAPQDANGLADPQRGIREFVVGTGGAPPYPFVSVQPNSEMRLSTNGVLRLTLGATGYDWTFIALSGPGDSGHATCH